jgi:hypothetical protein
MGLSFLILAENFDDIKISVTIDTTTSKEPHFPPD